MIWQRMHGVEEWLIAGTFSGSRSERERPVCQKQDLEQATARRLEECPTVEKGLDR